MARPVYVVKRFWVRPDRIKEFEDRVTGLVSDMIHDGIVTDTGPTTIITDKEFEQAICMFFKMLYNSILEATSNS